MVIRRAVMVLIGLVFLISTVQANGPAIVSDVVCLMMASDGSLFPSEGKAVFASDNNGNSILTCKGTQPAEIPRPDRSLHFDYAHNPFPEMSLLLSTTYGETHDWKEVITPGGQVILTVKITPNPTP